MQCLLLGLQLTVNKVKLLRPAGYSSLQVLMPAVRCTVNLLKLLRPAVGCTLYTVLYTQSRYCCPRYGVHYTYSSYLSPLQGVQYAYSSYLGLLYRVHCSLYHSLAIYTEVTFVDVPHAQMSTFVIEVCLWYIVFVLVLISSFHYED